jgi:hypothetical protein
VTWTTTIVKADAAKMPERSLPKKRTERSNKMPVNPDQLYPHSRITAKAKGAKLQEIMAICLAMILE